MKRLYGLTREERIRECWRNFCLKLIKSAIADNDVQFLQSRALVDICRSLGISVIRRRKICIKRLTNLHVSGILTIDNSKQMCTETRGEKQETK